MSADGSTYETALQTARAGGLSELAAGAEIPREGGAGDAGALGFAHGVARRFDKRTMLLVLFAIVATELLTRIAHFDFRGRDAVDWLTPLLVNAVMVTCVACALVTADEAVARGMPRWRTYVSAVLVGCALGAYVQGALLVALGWQFRNTHVDAVVPQLTESIETFFIVGLYSTLACFVYVNHRTARLAADRMHSAELARARSRRRTFESRLQAMQARVEPQFLFNTLAQVRELYERDAETAGRMLDDLIAYLRAALPHLRESSSTLGQEIALARAYLNIMRMRLGARLDFDIEVGDANPQARMPPMMLLPLLDHALVYGLQPIEARGTIRIRARASDGRLQLAITDSGVAFLPGATTGDLDGIAERLRTLYGDAALLSLEQLNDAGTRARMEIPYEGTDRSPG